MRLDHLLSKGSSKGYSAVRLSVRGRRKKLFRMIMEKISGGDASRGNTRPHPEHDGEDLHGREYYAGDGMGE